MTPETRAELRRLAVEYRRAIAADQAASFQADHDKADKAADARSRAGRDFTDALDPATILQLLDASEPVAGGDAGPMAVYDAGLFSISGGGNVDWWLDYLRAELGRAHEFYDDQYEQLRAAYARLQAENDKLKAALGYLERSCPPFDPSCDDRTVELAVELTYAEERRAKLQAERDAAVAEAGRLTEALQFYADSWRGNMIGDGEAPGTSYCFQEPTDALWQDAGSIARAALAGSTP